MSGSAAFCLGFVLGGLLAAPAPAQEPPPDLDARRAALRERVQQPALLEGSGFQLFLDRRDGSFRIEESAHPGGWHSSIERRGFASVLSPGADGRLEELPVDRVEDLRAGDKWLRFRAASSKGPLPDLHFELRALDAPAGLEIAVRGGDELFARGGRVRLLDRALPVFDADNGGAVLPIGLGEWYPADEPKDFTRVLSLLAAPAAGAPAAETPLRPVFSAIALLAGGSGLILHWTDPELALDVAGGPQTDARWPGMRAVCVSATLAGAARSLRLHFAGRLELPQLLGALPSILLQGPEPPRSLRFKSSARPGLQTFLGAALFDVDFRALGPRLGAPGSFEAVAAAAEGLARRLGIDEALFMLKGWEDVEEEPGAAPRAREDLGGAAGLAACRERLNAAGHLLGLALPASRHPWSPGFPEEAIEGFFDGFPADLAHLPIDAAALAEGGVPALARVRERGAALGALLGDRVLLGSTFVDESQFRAAALLEGALDHKLLGFDGGRFVPAVSAAFGTLARMAPGPGWTLEPGDVDAFLSCVLLAEVPRYRLPPRGGDALAGEAAARDPYCRGDGWAQGRELSIAERHLKNTYEVLAPLARLRVRTPAFQYRKLGAGGRVEEIYYGFDLRLVVNRGDADYEDEEGQYVLPPKGFWVQHPLFLAFHARRALRYDLAEPGLFTVRSLEGKLWLRAEKVRIWRGFGPKKIELGGKELEVEAEIETRIW